MYLYKEAKIILNVIYFSNKLCKELLFQHLHNFDRIALLFFLIDLFIC